MFCLLKIDSLKLNLLLFFLTILFSDVYSQNKPAYKSKKEILVSKNSDTIKPVENKNRTTTLQPPDKLSKDYSEALKQVLSLDNSQYSRILTVNRDLIEKIDDLVYSSKDYSTFKEGIKIADQERLFKYKSILNPSQLKMYVADGSLSGLNKVMAKNSNSNASSDSITMKDNAKPEKKSKN
jgi:hypothetical protein